MRPIGEGLYQTQPNTQRQVIRGADPHAVFLGQTAAANLQNRDVAHEAFSIAEVDEASHDGPKGLFSVLVGHKSREVGV